MSQYYRASLHFVGDGDKEVLVESAKCRYQVWLGEDEVALSGPGVDELSSLESLPDTGGKMDDEDFAVLVVLLFENGLWPSE